MERADVSSMAVRATTSVKRFSMKGPLPKLQRVIVVGGISVLLLIAAFSISGVENVLQRLVRFSPEAIAGILVLLTANLFQVSFRLWRVLAHFGFPLPWNVAFRASISGHMAGLFVMSLFGQVLGRQTILRKYGVRPVVMASLSAYERALLAFISGAMCVLGVGFLPVSLAVADFWGRMPFTEIVLVAAGGAVLSIWLGRSRFETRLAARIRSWSAFSGLAESAGITLISQFLVLGSFVVGIRAIQPEIDIVPLFAAAAVISFAASIPVTVNGWGIREVTAVYVLGRLGISAADAVAVSVLIGLCSTAVIVAASPFAFKKTSGGDTGLGESPQMDKPAHDVEKASAWILSMAAAVLIFFQVHAELPGSLGLINLNIADPFAILALAAVSIHALYIRCLPSWRVQSFNVILAMISVVLLLSFLRGLLEIGVTQWALAGRVFGWLVLLGYISAGYLMVAYAGAHGLRRLSETMIATGAVVVVLQILLRLLHHWGVDTGARLTDHFEGYAGNRNAFAFQLLVGMALLLGYFQVYARHSFCFQRPARKWIFSLLLGILLAGLVWNGSRTGMLVGVMALLLAGFSRLADRKMLGWGVIFAALLWCVVLLAAQKGLIQGVSSIDFLFQSNFSMESSLAQSNFSREGSDMEHWETLTHGLEMWRQSPVLGAGLGVFHAKSAMWLGHPQVIHSTPLWILAEFGLLGGAVFGWAFFLLARHAIRFGRTQPARRILLLLLLAFSIFSLAHEIFYQRIYWLVLGAVLARPFASSRHA
jgi:uncharacterized membrane protein YbhN (UPF0104 family)